jgi:hypothetical protein
VLKKEGNKKESKREQLIHVVPSGRKANTKTKTTKVTNKNEREREKKRKASVNKTKLKTLIWFDLFEKKNALRKQTMINKWTM